MRLLKTTAFLLPASIAFAAGPLHAASPFDGTWKGEGRPTAACAEKADLNFTLKDREFVEFRLAGPRGQVTNVRGSLTEGGTAAIEYGPRRLRGNLVFNDNGFEGKLDTSCGLREFVGARER